MDCSTARLFLTLGGHEAEELKKHLEHCSECNALDIDRRRLDQHLGQAMLAVEVPKGLRKQILERLEEERQPFSRRSFARTRKWVGAAAAAVLVLVGAYW